MTVVISSQPHGGKAAIAQFMKHAIPLIGEDVPDVDGVEATGSILFNVFDVVEAGWLEVR